jgi:hypothetical protein
MLNEDELRDALLLVFANKQDLPNARASSWSLCVARLIAGAQKPPPKSPTSSACTRSVSERGTSRRRARPAVTVYTRVSSG